MAKSKRTTIEVSKDEGLVKRLEEAAKKLRDKNIKAIIFNHKNLVYNTRGLAVYNPITRTVVTLGSIRETDISIAPDIIINESRLDVIEKVSNLDDLLSDADVYAVIDTQNNFKCSESEFDKKLDFDSESEDCLIVYYNGFTSVNNYPKYLVREKKGQYKLCSECHKLLLDELDYADIHDNSFCYDCIVSKNKEYYVDSKKLKLMQLHKLESE